MMAATKSPKLKPLRCTGSSATPGSSFNHRRARLKETRHAQSLVEKEPVHEYVAQRGEPDGCFIARASDRAGQAPDQRRSDPSGQGQREAVVRNTGLAQGQAQTTSLSVPPPAVRHGPRGIGRDRVWGAVGPDPSGQLFKKESQHLTRGVGPGAVGVGTPRPSRSIRRDRPHAPASVRSTRGHGQHGGWSGTAPHCRNHLLAIARVHRGVLVAVEHNGGHSGLGPQGNPSS